MVTVTLMAAAYFVGFATATHPQSRPILRSGRHARSVAGGALLLSSVLLFAVLVAEWLK